jgi:ATP-binding cassette subfamily C protein
MPLLDLVMAFIMIIFVVAAMLLSTSAITMLGVAITGGGVALVIRLFRRRLENTGQVLRDEGKVIIESIQQGFGALVDSRIIGCESYLGQRFRQSITRQSQMQTARNTIMRVTPLAIEVVALAGLLIIFLVIMRGSSSFAEAIPVMSVLGVATIRLKQVATRVSTQVNMLNQSRAYIPNLIKDIHYLDGLAEARMSADGGSSLAGNRNTGTFELLELENVVYTYPDRELGELSKLKPAVNGVSLKLRRGESIAFVGATGCGKSTLVNLVLGLLEPNQGTIKVNGKDIFSDLPSWRRLLGYIPQTIFLLDDSIRANIAFGIPPNEISEEQLRLSLKSARLDEFVSSLPDGINTVVGERGVRLSGGQRQRIGIARALYFDPEVLVMDEATSALDNKTESDVMEAIQNLKKGRTLIMVAHRLSTVEDCDRLYYLQDGKLLEQGSYTELMKSSEGFRTTAGASEGNQPFVPAST